ncbi:uncharacterized protein A1O9_12558 [Exophiala aquamarina CBS 119918]|uniref:Uncharacterized protein n=1 Tax=Exophiala aquamarina CBS 119918 TaxID=1182545 RepID=A0A072NU69_9EURO|nr:uncharacterized protein A1O9_12558 [Exophiala aquamarina CBS 119918]KEF51409.1 hypothetical protein A1O9_12558 [Exophiala aquamarina CBS 119918]
MINRTAARAVRWATGPFQSLISPASHRTTRFPTRVPSIAAHTAPSRCLLLRPRAFHTYTARLAQSPTADALMENLNELYATAKDEFEIAAEETEKKTVYAADDREAAQDALKSLQEGYEKAIKESAPDVAKEVQSRVGPRIRELANAVKAMEEMAMED